MATSVHIGDIEVSKWEADPDYTVDDFNRAEVDIVFEGDGLTIPLTTVPDLIEALKRLL